VGQSYKVAQKLNDISSEEPNQKEKGDNAECEKDLYLCLHLYPSSSFQLATCSQFHQHFISAFAPILLRQKKFKPKM
jgi:hypothetical protein